MANTYKGKSTKLGGGGKFAKMSDSIQRQGKTKAQADAIAASAGRKKYGAAKMAEMSASGRKRRG